MIKVGQRYKILKNCTLRESQICDENSFDEKLNNFFIKEFNPNDEIEVISICSENCYFPHEIKILDISSGVTGVLEIKELETPFYKYKSELQDKAENNEITFNEIGQLLGFKYLELFDDSVLKDYIFLV